MNNHGFTSINGKALRASLRRATMSFLFLLVASLPFLLSTGCTNTSKAVVTVDRHNPEAVLQAYFDAWERGDWADQTSFMDDKYAQMASEPVDSIRMIEIQPIGDSSSTQRTYHVIFEIKVKGQGVSMHNGRYDWNYYLTGDAKFGTWLITNYGSG